MIASARRAADALPPVLADIPRRVSPGSHSKGSAARTSTAFSTSRSACGWRRRRSGAFTGCREEPVPRPRDRQGDGCRSVRRRHPARLARPPHPGAPRGPDTRGSCRRDPRRRTRTADRGHPRGGTRSRRRPVRARRHGQPAFSTSARIPSGSRSPSSPASCSASWATTSAARCIGGSRRSSPNRRNGRGTLPLPRWGPTRTSLRRSTMPRSAPTRGVRPMRRRISASWLPT